MSNLTDKQSVFVDEYLINLNATQAAIRAGYSEKTAKEIGSQNLAKPAIQEAIAERMKARQKRTNIHQDMVIEGLKNVAFADIRKLFDGDRLLDIGELPDEIVLALASVEVVASKREDGSNEVEHTHKIRINDRLRALEMLGRHLAMFTDKIAADLTLDPIEALMARIDGRTKSNDD
jgi:phage terminase small subunit|tara:strand:+ start:3554 stop:4084 length:531 start_codon:yes stop_codon:yes gene_type:complete